MKDYAKKLLFDFDTDLPFIGITKGNNTMNKLTKEQYIKTAKNKRPALLAKYGTTEAEVLGNVVQEKTYVVIKEFPNGWVGDEVVSLVDLEKLYPEYYKLKVTDKPKVHHIYLVDQSSSMSTDNKIGTVSERLPVEMQAASVSTDATFSIIGFNSSVNVIAKRTSVPVNNRYFCGGMTNLHGAIVKALALVEKGEHTLIKIFTDGDNNIYEYSLQHVKNLIDKLPKEVTVTFICTEQDKYLALRYVDESNVMTYDNTGKGLEVVLDKYIVGTVTYSNNITRGMDVSKGFFKDIK